MNVALLELNSFHDECLYSQVAMLKKNPQIKIFLVCHYRLKNRIDYWDLIDDVLFVGSNQWGIGYLKILSFFRKNNIQRCVFNSVHKSSISKLLSIASRKREYYGIMHDRENFTSKLSKKLNKYINGYFVLNDYMLDNIENFNKSNIPVYSIYTIYYQSHTKLKLDKKDDEIWVTIPGKIQNYRRDYKSLLNSLKQQSLNKNIKLIFLGQSIFMKEHGQEVRYELEQIDKNYNCLFWDSFIDKDTFHTYMDMTDYILPLIHSNCNILDNYRNKISGTFNLAFSYKKPMLMDKDFNDIADFKENAIFYDNPNNIVNKLNELQPNNGETYYNENKWDLDYQANNFMEHINIG